MAVHKWKPSCTTFKLSSSLFPFSLSLQIIPCTAFLHPVHFLPVSASHSLYSWIIFAALWLLQLKANKSWIWHWEWSCRNNTDIPCSCTVTKWNTDALEAVTQISLPLSLSVLFWMFVCTFICIYVATWSKHDSYYDCIWCRKIINAKVVLKGMSHVFWQLNNVSPFSVWILQSKKKFERECKEAEKSQLIYERLDNDINATKSEVEKVVFGILMYSTWLLKVIDWILFEPFGKTVQNNTWVQFLA